jgi:hypothetical protein
LSYPTFGSVNDFIDEKFTSVQYSLFDNAVSIARNLGKGALIRKKSAFRLLPIYPGDFDLLGFKIGSNYYIEKGLMLESPLLLKFWKRLSTSCYMFAILTMKQHFLLLAFQ